MTRRTLLRLVGGAGLAVAAACTGEPPPGSTARTPAPGGGPASSAAPTPSPASLSGLSTRLSTPLLRPGSPGYASIVGLYNPRFDTSRRPVAIAACRAPADVVECVRFAAESGTALHLRSGGHSYGGWSSGPGLVVDVRPMSSMAIDTASQTVRIGAGARLADVYETLGRGGVAIAAGSCPTVGLTGLALGGGVGVLSRAFGLTCDAIRSVQLVTADGTLREVDARHQPDLFWALRGGGGGSFGAVTALTLAVRPAPTVHTFFLSWTDGDAADVLSAWQGWMVGRDGQLWSTCKVLATPASGAVRAVIAGTWLGDSANLEQQLVPLLRAVGAPPRGRSARSLTYAQAMQLEAGCLGQTAQRCLTTSWEPAKRQPFAATSAILRSPLPEAGVSAAVAGAARALAVPGIVEGGLSFDALGGRVDDLAPSATAFVHRGALATIQYTATWQTAAAHTADPGPYDTYVRNLRDTMLGWTGTSAYVNYADASLRDYGPAYWGANYPRLSEIKRRYDPHDLFRFAQSVSRS